MIVEISIVPIGVGESLSQYVVKALKIIESKISNYKLTPMGTIFEIENFKELGKILDEIVDELIKNGVPRVYTVIKSDFRIKSTTMDYKVEKVKAILKFDK